MTHSYTTSGDLTLLLVAACSSEAEVVLPTQAPATVLIATNTPQPVATRTPRVIVIRIYGNSCSNS